MRKIHSFILLLFRCDTSRCRSGISFGISGKKLIFHTTFMRHAFFRSKQNEAVHSIGFEQNRIWIVRDKVFAITGEADDWIWFIDACMLSKNAPSGACTDFHVPHKGIYVRAIGNQFIQHSYQLKWMPPETAQLNTIISIRMRNI